MTDVVRVIAPTGNIGAGFDEEAFLAAGERVRPDFIGVDSGTTDMGPHALGSGIPHQSRASYRRDLGVMLRAAHTWNIPLLIGSAGTAGADANVRWAQSILEEVATEAGLHFNLAIIRSEQDPAYLKEKLAAGRIRPLYPELPISEDVLNRSAHIVGMMGVEPFQAALERGADVVLAGRASDTSIFSAIPIQRGLPPGPVWHSAKILECGGAAAVHTTAAGLDGMIGTIRADGFDLEPCNPTMRASIGSIASHSLYENRSPFDLVEPAGVLDMSGVTYEQLDERSVRVSGSRFTLADDYTIKLEGCELVGYQSIVIAGVRDPEILKQFDEWLDGVEARAARRLDSIYGESRPGHQLRVRVYGRDGVMGPLEPTPRITGHEVCLIFESTAPTQVEADTAAQVAASIAAHHPIPQWSGLITGLAYPYSPTVISKGPSYRFNLNHIVLPDNPLEMFPIQMVEV